jgi:hypothetical protein
MLHVRELESTPRPHTTLVSPITTSIKSKTGYGIADPTINVDPVLRALSTEAPPGGMLSTLKSANTTGMRIKREISMT